MKPAAHVRIGTFPGYVDRAALDRRPIHTHTTVDYREYHWPLRVL